MIFFICFSVTYLLYVLLIITRGIIIVRALCRELRRWTYVIIGKIFWIDRKSFPSHYPYGVNEHFAGLRTICTLRTPRSRRLHISLVRHDCHEFSRRLDNIYLTLSATKPYVIVTTSGAVSVLFLPAFGIVLGRIPTASPVQTSRAVDPLPPADRFCSGFYFIFTFFCFSYSDDEFDFLSAART